MITSWLVQLARVPVQPDREQARSWAVEELSRREYQDARPGPLERLVTWFLDALDRLDVGPGAPPFVTIVIVILLVGAFAGYLRYRVGGLHRSARRAGTTVFSGEQITAAHHREAANRHAAAGQWDQAVVERFRAIARELEERALLSPQPGRTALEVAANGGQALPELATDLRAAARHFDDVSYGHLSVGPSADVALRELDDRLRAARSLAVR
jgi:hypothetical protein